MNNKAFFIMATFLFSASFSMAQKKQPTKPANKNLNGAVVNHLQGKVQTPSKAAEKFYFVDIITDSGAMRVVLYNETPQHRDNFLKLADAGFFDSLLFHRVIKDFMIQGGDPGSKNAVPEAMLGNGDVGYRIPAEFNKNLYHKRGALAAARDNNPDKASSGCQFYIVQGKKFAIKELSDAINQLNYNKKMSLVNAFTQRDSIKTKLDDFVLRGDNDGMQKYMLSMQPVIDKQFESMYYNPSPRQVSDYVMKGGAPHLDGNYTVFGEVISGLEVLDKIAAMPVNSMSRPLTDIRMKMKIVKQ